jgi:hypothetical protein
MNFSTFTKSYMNRLLLTPVVAAFLLAFASGCNMVNPVEKLPTYISIDSFDFQGNTNVTGSNSHRISSVFVFLNNQSIGIFDLPATFPVIMDKPGKLMFTAGVNYNGMHSYQIQYPFYLSDTITLDPATSPDVTQHVVPVARYYPSVKFSYMQDFENYLSAPFINAGSDTSITVGTGGEALDGKFGLITISSTHDSSVNITRDGFAMPANSDLYLEMDYKSNIPITIGLQTLFNGDTKQAYIVGFNPRDTWGKVYIDLRTFVSTYQGGTYKLLVRAVRTAGITEGKVMIDNLKIVHF